MSTINAPFGLRPAYHNSGLIRPRIGTITTGYASNIYNGSPVGYIADGSIALTAAGGTGVAGACGAFQGVEYNPTATAPRAVSNMWPASLAAVNIVAYFTDDPYIIYEIQGNAPVTQASLGNQFNWTVNDTTAGNTTTGLSNVALDVASAGANKGMRVVGITPGADNIYGDLFTVVQVQLSQHQFVATIAAI